MSAILKSVKSGPGPAPPAAPDTAADPAVRGRGLTRIYTLGSESVAGIDSVDITVSKGELVVLKGESGSGKSTLLSLIGGLDRLTSGELLVAGRRLDGASEVALTDFRRRSVGMVFQAFNLLPTLTVFENVLLPALLAGRSIQSARPKALELISWLGLETRRNHHPRELSGGQMQRTAIARALINDPAIVLADEPTGNLDSENARKVMALLSDSCHHFGRTVLIATHSDLADPYATRVLRLKDGRLAA